MKSNFVYAYFFSDSNTNNSKEPGYFDEKSVDFKEVRSVLNGVYGGSQNVESEESSFPMQQKVLLCSLMLILNKGRNKDITIGKVRSLTIYFENKMSFDCLYNKINYFSALSSLQKSV